MVKPHDENPEQGANNQQTIDDKCKVGPTFKDIIKHVIKEGTIDLYEMEKLKGRYEDRKRCDVKEGPCCCAWHYSATD